MGARRTSLKAEVSVDDWLNDPKIKKFGVKDPVKISGHVKYTCTGEDS